MLLTPSYEIKNMLETLMVDHLHNYAVHMLLTPLYGTKNMLEALMLDHLHNSAVLGRAGGAQEPKIGQKLL